jgi:Zn-dependent peptidase ImmA (M78 family)
MIETIRIGYRQYQLKPWTDAEMVTTESYGQCDKQRAIIYYCTHLDDMLVADTLIHEINHAIWNEYNLQDSDTEERIVHSMGSGWT